MLSGLKQLPLISKIIFIVSLLILFVWVIPTMVNYLKNVQTQEKQLSELHENSLKYGISKDAKSFNKESFLGDTLKDFSNVSVVAAENKSYNIRLEVEKDKMNNFHTFLKTLSLRYLVKVTSPITFQEKDKLIEVNMVIQEL